MFNTRHLDRLAQQITLIWSVKNISWEASFRTVSFKQKLQLPHCQHSNIKYSRYRSTNSCSIL